MATHTGQLHSSFVIGNQLATQYGLPGFTGQFFQLYSMSIAWRSQLPSGTQTAPLSFFPKATSLVPLQTSHPFAMGLKG